MRTTAVVLLVAALSVSAISPASAARTPDRTAPSAGFTTTDGAVKVSAAGGSDLAATHGWTRDRSSGVQRVVVTYCPGSKGADGSWTCGSTGSLGSVMTARADLSCTSSRRSCAWSAPVPQRPGRYLVFARATDRAGHSRAAGPVEIVVA